VGKLSRVGLASGQWGRSSGISVRSVGIVFWRRERGERLELNR